MSQQTKLVVSLLFLLITTAVHSSGFRIPETSVAGIGTANALVANPDEIGSLPYNPANMAFIDGRSMLAGMTNISTDIHVDPDAGTATDNTGESSFLVPHYYYTNTLNTKWSYGLFINVPFGLETKWPDETFAAFTGATDPLEPELSKIEMINLNPNVSLRVDNFSFAFGLNYYDIRELVFNTQAIQISGNGGDVGWNIAAQHVNGDLSFGFSYRSNVDTALTGTVIGFGDSGTADASLDLPSILQAGVRYKLNRDWSVEFDLDRTGWSSFDEINITHTNTTVAGATGSNTITSTNNWEDSNAYRIGATWQFEPEAQIRFGFTLDETPQGDTDFSPRIPDNDRTLLSAGYQRDMKSWSFELGYMYVKNDDRKLTATGATAAYNGTYTSTVHLLGASFSMKL